MIEEAHNNGARYAKACEVLEISTRTFERWRSQGPATMDHRPFAKRPTPKNALSKDEKDEIVRVCSTPEYSSLTPDQIVPKLADKGIYIASERTFYRVLKERKLLSHRSRSKPQTKRQIVTHEATAPCQIWSTDISYLRGPVLGVFFYLYFVMDTFSRKIVGFEVYDRESSEHLAEVVKRATLLENNRAPKMLHSDNGSPMKGVSLLELLRTLDICHTFSRPHVSDDNPYIESLFKTTKYFPGFPYQGFRTLDEAREWIRDFVAYYNFHHCHSGLNYVTPNEAHTGSNIEILAKRAEVYRVAKQINPSRWISGKLRNWSPAAGGKIKVTSKKSDKITTAA